MRALILAAGRGLRLRPLTERVPKPLLAVGGKPLIAWHLEKLATLGVTDVVVNTAHLAEAFPAALGEGERWGLRIRYSHEGAEPLETGGGMLHALPLLGPEPFIAINGDIWTDYDLARLPSAPAGLAHLVLVGNPAQHPGGDFHLDAGGGVHAEREPRLTFAGIGVYRPELLADWRTVIGQTPGAGLSPPHFPLAPLLRAAMARAQVSGEHHPGTWTDAGTAERLAELDAALR